MLLCCTLPATFKCPYKTRNAGGSLRKGIGSCFQMGEGEHLAAKSLKAKWQLIHTDGIWLEVEGIREEPASRKLALLSSSQLPSFITRPPPDVAANSFTQNPLPLQQHVETLLPAPNLLGLCSNPLHQRQRTTPAELGVGIRDS